MSSGGGGSSGMRGSSGGSSGGSWAPPTSSTSSTMTPSQSRWYFSAESLHMTPSRRHNISSEKELSYRQQAANLIQDMGQRLQVPQLCINTAIVYMQRFYMFHSFTRFHRNTIAAASIFLAAKVEEQPRKLEHVIKVAHICIHGDQSPPDPRTEQYMEQAQELVTNESILLQTLGFDVAIDHPHTHVVKCCQLVKASKELAQTSYLMASNSLHLTTMCLRHSPTIVACVCIHLACKWAKYQIPLSSRGKEWFLYVDPNATLDLLNKLTEEFLTIFEKCPSRLKKKIMASTKATKEEEERRALGDISASHYQPDYSRRTEAASTTNPSKHPPSTQPKTGQVPPGRISSNQHPPRPDKPHHSSQQPHHRSSTVPPPGQPAPDKPSKPTDVSRATYDEYKKQKQQQQPPQVPQGQSTQSRSSSQQTHRHISSSSRPPQGQSSSQHLSLIQQPPQRPPSAAPSPLPSQQQLQKHHKHNGPPPQQQSSRHQQPPVAQHGHGWQSKSKPEQHRHHKQPPPQQHTQQQLPRHHAAYPQHSSQQQSKSDRKPNLPPQHPKKSIFDIDESPPLPVQKEPPSILPQASTSLNSNQTTGSNNGLLNLMLDPVVPSHSLIKPDALTVKVSPSKKEKSLSPSKKHRHDKTASLFSPPSSTSSNGTPTPTPSRVEETPGYEKLRDGRTSIRLPKDGDKSFTKTAELPIDVVTTDEKSEELSGESERKKHKKEKKSKKEKKEKKEKKDKERSKDKSHKHKHKDKDRSKDSSSKHHHSHHQHSSSSIVPITTGSHSSYNSTGDSSVIQKPHGIKLKIKPIPPQNQESAPPPKLDPLKISLKSTTDSKKRQRPSADNRTSSPSSKMARILDSNDGSNDYLKSHDGRSKKT